MLKGITRSGMTGIKTFEMRAAKRPLASLGLLMGTFCLTLLTDGVSHAAVMYTFTNLGIPSGIVGSQAFGAYIQATGINDLGEVVGNAADDFNHTSFSWQNGQLISLGGFSANAINNSGAIVGNSSGNASIYQNGILSLLPRLSNSDNTAYTTAGASGINNNGTVVGGGGIGDNFNGTSRAGIFATGGSIVLPNLGGLSANANGINDSGTIVGVAVNTSGEGRAFRYSGGPSLTDLGTLGGSSATAIAINAGGEIVGSAALTGNTASHAFIDVANQMIDLGTLGGTSSTADAINILGQVVGSSNISGNSENHAFIYQGGVMTDLNSLIQPGLGADLQSATGINSSGWIVGTGFFGTGHFPKAYLLVPISVPEPASCGTLLIGGAAMLLRRRQRSSRSA